MRAGSMKNRITPVRIMAAAFICVILIGAALLACPFSSASGKSTGFIDALFTATSATCVTGLVVFDTGLYWSTFGKCVIICLIQIGGLGAMTIITALAAAIKGRVSLQDSRMLMQSAGTLSLGGLKKIVRRIFIGTASFELLGAVSLATQFVPVFGWGRGILSALFHSVSAFCNAGFDILGEYGGGASLSVFSDNVTVNLTVMALIVIGGLGFIVWSDLLTCRFRFGKLCFHSKIVLTVSAALLLLGGALFYVFEADASMAGLSAGNRAMTAMFQSVTTRTAGFSTIDQSALSESGALLTMFLMLVGGSPGSTAGGIKTTTLAVLILSAAASAGNSGQPTAFKRRIETDAVQKAVSVVAVYIAVLLTAIMLIAAIEPYPLKQIAYEAVSAIGTVGLTMGITPALHSAAKLILTILMFAGRVGGLSAAMVLGERSAQAPVSRPTGRLLIG